jgi:hypothetical protein
MPAKKPKGKGLTNEQKERNKEISKFRILVEHSISGVKRCSIIIEFFYFIKTHPYPETGVSLKKEAFKQNTDFH